MPAIRRRPTSRCNRSRKTPKRQPTGCLFSDCQKLVFLTIREENSRLSRRALPCLVGARGERRARPKEFFRRTCRRKNGFELFAPSEARTLRGFSMHYNRIRRGGACPSRFFLRSQTESVGALHEAPANLLPCQTASAPHFAVPNDKKPPPRRSFFVESFVAMRRVSMYNVFCIFVRNKRDY